MKKFILLPIIVFAFILSVNAQIKKGSIFLGGDINGSVQKTKSGNVTTNKQSGINISPVLGKASKENLIVGTNVSVGLSDNNSQYKTNFYGLGVFVRKYKNIGTSGFYVFAQGGLNGIYSKTKQISFNSTDTKRYTIYTYAYPGISYAVSKKFQLETGFQNILAISYSHEKREENNPVNIFKTNEFSIYSSLNNASSALYFGFRLLISK